ncbi:MAG: bactofilin family protein [Akkermansiaceae bacterium]
MFEKIISKSPEDPPAPRPASPVSAATPMANPGHPPAPGAAPAPAAPAQQAPPQQQAPAPGGQRNILSNDVHINGSVLFTNDLLVDGRIEGKITSDGALTVAENATIKAEVKTKSIVIYGKVHGNVSCTERVDIKASAEMVGDVKAGTLSVEPGAIFVGKSEVGTPSAAPKKEEPAPQQGNAKKGNNQPQAKGNNQPQGKGGNNQPPKKGVA